VRAERTVLSADDFSAARDRLLLGRRDAVNAMLPGAVGSRPRSGPIGYGAEGPTRDNPFAGRPYAEQTQRATDREVARLLREAEATASRLVRGHRAALDRIISLLLERETIDGSELIAAAAEAALGATDSVPERTVVLSAGPR
jgi:ATP-dependent Zn protease